MNLTKQSDWTDAIKGLAGAAKAQFNSASPVTQGALIGGGLGGLLTGGTSLMNGGDPTETPAQRRSRLLRDATMGTVLGAGAGATLPMALDTLNGAMPPPTPTDEAAQNLAQSLGRDQPMGGNIGSLLASGGTAALIARRKGSELNAALKQKATEFLKNFNTGKTQAHGDLAADLKARVESTIRTQKARLNTLQATDPAQYQAEMQRITNEARNTQRLEGHTLENKLMQYVKDLHQNFGNMPWDTHTVSRDTASGTPDLSTLREVRTPLDSFINNKAPGGGLMQRLSDLYHGRSPEFHTSAPAGPDQAVLDALLQHTSNPAAEAELLKRMTSNRPGAWNRLSPTSMSSWTGPQLTDTAGNAVGRWNKRNLATVGGAALLPFLAPLAGRAWASAEDYARGALH
jgi:gas vesicle protein